MAATARKQVPTSPDEAVVIPMKHADARLLAVGSITHSIEEITPQMAEKMLEKNTVNRALLQTDVNTYSRIMSNGLWLLSVIWLDAKGNIIDGQHRLTAVVQSGVKVKFLVVRNAPQGQQDVIDQQRKRSLKDVLTFRGEEFAQQLGAVARIVNLVETRRISLAQMRLSNEEVIGTIEAYPDLRMAAEIAEWSKFNRASQINPSVIGATWWLIKQRYGADEATRFVNRVCTLAGEREGSPILALNKRVSEIRKWNQRFSIRDQIATLIKVWNYDAAGRSVRSVTTRNKDGRFVMPDIKPRKYAQEGDPAAGFSFEEADDDDE